MATTSGRARGRPKAAMSSEARRTQLIGAAITVIRRDGAAVSMDDIAAEAGVTKPVLYSHFGDKNGLAAEVADVVGEVLAYAIGAQLDTGDGPARPPDEQLLEATRSFITWVRAEPEMFSFLVSTGTAEGGRPHVLTVADRVADEVVPALEILYSTIGREQSKVALHAHGIVGFIYIAVEHWSRSGSPEDFEDLLGSLVSFVWAGINDPAAIQQD